MNDTRVCVSALGMVSALGHDVITSCAAARAGLSRASELKVLSQPFGKLTLDGPPVVRGHAVPGIGEGFSGAGKVLALGAAALRDLLGRRPIEPREAMRTGLILCLADHALIDAFAAQRAAETGSAAGAPSAVWRQEAAGLATRLALQVELDLPEPRCVELTLGGPGLGRALGTAIGEMVRGSVDRVLVGGVDSRIEPRFLTAAAGLSALRTNERPVGLIGGEAAAFILLERERDVRSAGRAPLAFISGLGLSTEGGSHFGDAPVTGRALAEAVLAALATSHSTGSRPSLVIGELNGTERRGHEWGCALARLQAAGVPVDLPAWYPAASFGDTGAAAGAVSLCMAVRAFERGYAPGPRGLVWVCSESGTAAAIFVEAVK